MSYLKPFHTTLVLNYSALVGKWQKALIKLHVLDDEDKAGTAGESPTRSCDSGEGLFVLSFNSLPLGCYNGKQTINGSWSGDGRITITVLMAR